MLIIRFLIIIIFIICICILLYKHYNNNREFYNNKLLRIYDFFFLQQSKILVKIKSNKIVEKTSLVTILEYIDTVLDYLNSPIFRTFFSRNPLFFKLYNGLIFLITSLKDLILLYLKWKNKKK